MNDPLDDYDKNGKVQRKDKTCIVTGCTSGIGLALVKDLTLRGINVIMPCRNTTRGVEIAKNSGISETNVYYMDLEDIESIDEFVEKLEERKMKVDYLINNAAVLSSNINSMYMTNVEGPYYLTRKLVSLMSTECKIINVSSIAHSMAKPDENNIFPMSKRKSDDDNMLIYGLTKLYNILISKCINENYKMECIAVNPGYVKTELYREELSGILKHIKNGTNLAKSAEEGARGIIYVLLETEDLGGKYMSDLYVESVCEFENSEKVREKLWEYLQSKYNK